jgi:tetratricopeptide (TPR) repeat protein
MALSARATRKERLYIEAAHARSVERDRLKEFGILRQLAREFPGEKFVHHRLAGYHRARGELYRAIEEYNQVLALDPEFGWAMNELGYMYTDVGDFERASQYFERYAAASPDDANPVDSMGELCFRMGRLDEAVARYRQALELNPDFYYAYWEIAYVSALKGDYLAALDWIERFIEHAPSFGTAAEGHRWRCLYKYWVGRLSEAMSDATLIAELATEEGSELWVAEANRMRAWVHYDRGDFVNARKCIEACLEVMERSPRDFIPAESSYSQGSLEQVNALKSAHLLSLGLIDMAEHQLGKARSRLDIIRQAVPTHAARLEAELLMHEGRLDESIMMMEGAELLEIPYMSDTEGMLAYNLPPMKDTLAQAYAKKGETYKSIAEYERLTVIRPDSKDRRIPNPRYRVRLARLYESKGWVDRALEQYRAFLDVFDKADDDIEELRTSRARVAELE